MSRLRSALLVAALLCAAAALPLLSLAQSDAPAVVLPPCDGSGDLIDGVSCDPSSCRFSLAADSGAVNATCAPLLANNSACYVACAPGLISVESTVFTCEAGLLESQFVRCVEPQPCPLPANQTLPGGLLAGNCSVAAGAALTHDSFCLLQLEPNYEVVSGSLVQTCFHGSRTPMPTVLRAPCHLPPLRANVLHGSCPQSEVLESGTNCSMACESAYLPSPTGSESEQLHCRDGVLSGAQLSCAPAPSCPLPPTWPQGTTAGSCAGRESLGPMGESCTLQLSSGHSASGGPLTYTCDMGVMRSSFRVVPTPCTLPSRPSARVRHGSCSAENGGLASGAQCQVQCDDDYETSDPLVFSCHLGTLSGSWPKCQLRPCPIPRVLAPGSGLTAGNCIIGGVLRADGDGFPAQCTLGLEAQYVLATSSLTLTCSRRGELSEMPTTARSITPTMVQGACAPNVNGQGNIAALRFLQPAVCPTGMAAFGWKLKSCGEGGLLIELSCAVTVLLATTAVQSVAGACVSSGSIGPGALALGTVQCPANSAMVGLSFPSCNSDSAQLQLVCRPLISASDQYERMGMFTQQRTTGHNSESAASTSTAGDLTRVLPSHCPVSEFNFVQSVSFSGPSDRLVQQIECMENTATAAGLAAAPASWFGAHVQARAQLDSLLAPQCVILPALRIHEAGRLFAVRLWARNLGPLTLQTYTHVKPNEFKIAASFSFNVTQLGYQQVGLPLHAQMHIEPGQYVGFCHGDVPIVEASDTGISSVAEWGSSGADPYSLAAWGEAAGVGQLAGGGASGVEVDKQRIYSLQVGVAGEGETRRFGSNCTDLPEDVKASKEASTPLWPENQCLVLEHPRLPTLGRARAFRFVMPSNQGKIMLRTYRKDAGGNFVLQGSVTPPTLQKGYQEFVVPTNSSWQVRPGDHLGFCYTSFPPVFRHVLHPVEAWPSAGSLSADWKPYKLWNTWGAQGGDAALPKWRQYNTGLDLSTGSPLQIDGPNLRSDIYRIPSDSYLSLSTRFQPDVSLQLELSADSACTPLSRTPEFGVGRVDCDKFTCVLTCPEGYATSKALQSCHPDGSWGDESQGRCEHIDMTAHLERSYEVAEQDPYSIPYRWRSSGSLPGGVYALGWELETQLLFPNVESDFALETLDGVVLANVTGTRLYTFPATTSTFVQRLDTKGNIEHLGVRARLRMLVTGGSTPWVSLMQGQQPGVTYAPCACNLNGAATQSAFSPSLSLTYGLPLNVQLTQKVHVMSELMISFTPNSLCTDSYSVSLEALDGTVLPTSSARFSTYRAANSKSCGFLTRMKQHLAITKYPMYGRELRVCMQAAPMPICINCASEYGVGTDAPPQLCLPFRAFFYTKLGGSVKTQPSRDNPVSMGVKGITLTAVILDFETGEALMFPQTDGSLAPLTFTTQTDVAGEWALDCYSDLLSARDYSVRVVPSRVDVDAASGVERRHNFTLADDATTDSFTYKVRHGDYVALIDFYDQATITLSGKVTLSPSFMLYGSDAFQSCGVFNLTVSLYESSDVDRTNELATSQATLHNGEWYISAPMYSSLVVVPRQEGVNRTFDPPFMQISTADRSMQLQPFVDTTTTQLTLEIDGGHCGFHVGSVRPTVFFDGCGASAHILLPSFAGGNGLTYSLPAVSYTMKLFDSKNPFSGLQSVDLDGTRLPNPYLNGDVFQFVAVRTRPFSVDFSTNQTAQSFSFRYFAVPDIVLKTPSQCSDPLVTSGPNDYAVWQKGDEMEMEWQMSETYGYVGAGGEDRRTICLNVTSAIELLDGVTLKGSNLLDTYVSNFSCTTGEERCILPTVVDSATSSVHYQLRVGEVQLSKFSTDETDTERTQPAFSRVIQWRLANSVGPYQPFFVVIVGSMEYPGKMSLVYPPWDALYILRDPPGGSSAATLTQGQTITSATGMRAGGESSFSTDFVFGLGMEKKHEKGIGLEAGASFFIKAQVAMVMQLVVLRIELAAQVQTHMTPATVSSRQAMLQRVNHIAVEHSVSTSSDPNIIDGDGDMFLTISGTFAISVSDAVHVNFTITPQEPPAQPTLQCKQYSQPELVWSNNPGVAYNWVSQHTIKNTLQPNLKRINKQLLQSNLVETVGALASVNAADYARYRENEAAWAGWQALLDRNQALKDDAKPWEDFTSALLAPGKSAAQPRGGLAAMPDDVTQTQAAKDNIDGAFSNAQSVPVYRKSIPGMVSETNGANAAWDDEPAKAEKSLLTDSNYLPEEATVADKSKRISSVTFYGDPAGSLLSFAFTVGGDSTTQKAAEVRVDTEGAGGQVNNFARDDFSSNSDTQWIKTINLYHDIDRSLSKATSTALSVALGDPDQGDMFRVAMYKDSMGYPVYKTTAGRSRCPRENNTMGREQPEIIIMTPALTNVHPDVSAVTQLQLLNHSPTNEEFVYALRLVQESNQRGLGLFINGQPLNSDTAQLAFSVSAGVNVWATLEVRRGEGSFDFPGVQIEMLAISPGGGDCTAVSATLNAQFDQPCAQIAFAGSVAVANSFTINSNNVLVSGRAMQVVTIHNPQYTLAGRQWSPMAAGETPYLTEIAVQYRAAGEAGDVLSEADWQDIKLVGDTLPATPLLKRVADGYAASPPTVQSDFLSLDWDMSTMADGAYQLRAKTQCRVPVGTQDTSLYTSVTPIISGMLDTSRPQLFGSPLPAASQWYPGGAISASFTKAISCNSYFGKARVRAWTNPGVVAGPQSEGRPVDLLLACAANTASVHFYAPVYDGLVGRLVTVLLDRVYDKAGNLMQGGSVSWSFQVALFDAKASSVELSGLQLQRSRAALLSQPLTRTLAELQAALETELRQLANRQVDAAADVPPTEGSVYLQDGAIVVSQLSPTGSELERTAFVATINQLPQFPGDPEPPFSPSYYARLLSDAVHKMNRTAESAAFPLLSTLLDPVQLAHGLQLRTFPVASPLGARAAAMQVQKARSHFRTMSAALPPYTLSSLDVGLTSSQSDSPRASMRVQWVVSSTTAPLPRLSAANVNASYQLMADNDAAVIEALGLGPIAIQLNRDNNADSDATAVQISVTSNTRFDNGVYAAVYAAQLLNFPTLAGGLRARLQLNVSDDSGQLLYTLDEATWIVGPPVAAVLAACEQPSADSMRVRFYPSQRSGMSAAAGDDDVTYSLQLSPLGASNRTASFAVPSSLFNVSRELDGTGLLAVSLTCTNLSGLALELGGSLPQDGTSVQWRVGISASTALATTALPEALQQTLSLSSVPPAQRIYRTAQIDMDAFAVRWRASTAYQLQRYLLSYRLDGDAARVTQIDLPVGSSELSVVSLDQDEERQKLVADGRSDSDLPPLLGLRLQLPSTSTGYSKVELSLSVCNLLGCSSARWQSVSAVVFASAPRLLSVRSVEGPVSSNGIVRLSLQWQSPQTLRPADPALLHAFRLSYSLILAGGASVERTVADLPAASSAVSAGSFTANVSLPFTVNPQDATQATQYVLLLRALVLNTNKAAQLYREDGMGAQLLSTEPALLYTNIGPVRNATASGANNGAATPDTPATGSGSTSGSGATTTTTTSEDSLFVAASPYPLEGSASSASAPDPPAGMLLQQLAAQPQHVRVLFAPVTGATSYQLHWFLAPDPSASGSGSSRPARLTPLGSVSIPGSQRVSGRIVTLLPNLVTSSMRQQSSLIKFALSAVSGSGAAGDSQSARVVDYLQLRPLGSWLDSFQMSASAAADGSTDGRALPLQSMRIAGLAGWSAVVPARSSVALRVLPTSFNLTGGVGFSAPSIVSIRAALLHSLPAGPPSLYFLHCPAASLYDGQLSEADTGSAAAPDQLLPVIHQLAACNQHTLRFTPQPNHINLILLQFTTHQFQQHYAAVHFTRN